MNPENINQIFNFIFQKVVQYPNTEVNFAKSEKVLFARTPSKKYPLNPKCTSGAIVHVGRRIDFTVAEIAIIVPQFNGPIIALMIGFRFEGDNKIHQQIAIPNIEHSNSTIIYQRPSL